MVFFSTGLTACVVALTSHVVIQIQLFCPVAYHECLSTCLSVYLFPLQDTNKVLAISRIMVAWQPLGLAMGTYDMCNRYLQQRQQFGSPLAAFQVGLLSDMR